MKVEISSKPFTIKTRKAELSLIAPGYGKRKYMLIILVPDLQLRHGRGRQLAAFHIKPRKAGRILALYSIRMMAWAIGTSRDWHGIQLGGRE